MCPPWGKLLILFAFCAGQNYREHTLRREGGCFLCVVHHSKHLYPQLRRSGDGGYRWRKGIYFFLMKAIVDVTSTSCVLIYYCGVSQQQDNPLCRANANPFATPPPHKLSPTHPQNSISLTVCFDKREDERKKKPNKQRCDKGRKNDQQMDGTFTVSFW